MEALIRALRQQVEVGARITPAQLPLATPCDGWTVRQVLNHSIGVTLKFAQFAAGATDTPRSPAGDLIGDDHVLALRGAAAVAVSAWWSTDMTGVCHLPFGSYRAEQAAGISLFDVVAHTWDVAVATGMPMAGGSPWDEALEAAQAVIGPHRDPRHYAPEVAVADDASPRQRFLAFLGRRDPPALQPGDP